ncbi:hypothetical protein KUV65_12615 [Maritalea mobilis]|uniref:hypothetical protein n=1 Tax=Maritalea mobilis TaxID=483324 RepID=UPI001C95B89D|nr:hypothetical protein [Maritalea mobilis]MBY6202212.1 hypothetical protein [Maritalea mobilis]
MAHRLNLWEKLSGELNYNVMHSQRGIINLFHSDGQGRRQDLVKVVMTHVLLPVCRRVHDKVFHWPRRPALITVKPGRDRSSQKNCGLSGRWFVVGIKPTGLGPAALRYRKHEPAPRIP